MKINSIEQSGLRGNLETVDAGIVGGWLFDSDNPAASQLFYIAIDDVIVAAGLANNFRADLVEAGIGNGCHGFSQYILVDDFDSSASSLSILDEERRLVKRVSLQSLSLQPPPRVALTRKSGSGLEFIWLGTPPLTKVDCVLYKNEHFVWAGAVAIDPASMRFWVPLPYVVLDGIEHCLGLGIKGYVNLVWSGVFQQSQIAVSSQNISGELSNFAEGGGDRASQRYRSINLQMTNLNELSSANQITIAHDYLSGKKNKNYPAFKAVKPADAIYSATVIIVFPESPSALYDKLMSFILAYEKVYFKVVVIHPKDQEWSELKSTFPYVEFFEADAENEAVESLIKLINLVSTPYTVFVNELQESCSNMVSSICEYLESDNIAEVVCAKLMSNGGVIREAGILFEENGDALINGLGQHWLSPEFNYRQVVDAGLAAPLGFRTKELLENLQTFNDAPSIGEALFSITKGVSERKRKVILCPEAISFCAPGPLLISEIAKQYDYPVNFSSASTRQLKSNNGSSKRILMFDSTTPTPDRDAGSYAAIKEIELIISLGFEVTFVPLDLQYKVEYTADLQRLGVEVLHKPFFMQIQTVLDERLATADGIYITRYNVAEKIIDYIKKNNPAIPIIFNNADLHFLREIRTALAQDNSEDLSKALETRDRELAIFKKADVLLSYTDAELAVITSLALTQDNLYKCPWVLTPKNTGKPFTERQGIAFLGGFQHLPNVAAVDFFVTQVMPLLTSISPDITFSIYGSNAPERFKAYESENVKVVGYVESLDDLFHHCRIFVCPLLSGAGIKGKVLESMSYGVPTILSTTAAEGTGLVDGLTTLMADGAESWVEAINALYNDELVWNSISANQTLLVDSLYSFEHGHSEMRKIFKFAKLL